MPEVSTYVDLCRGHDGCAPRGFIPDKCSPNVTAETFRVAREGDALVHHGCSAHPPHGAVVVYGFQTVLVNGRPIACVNASVSCLSAVLAPPARSSVLVGEGAMIR